jgi:hypothetical protein
MIVYDCPVCKHRSVMWDGRCRSFLCPCGASASPPHGIDPIDITLHRLDVTQDYLNKAMVR